MGTGQSIHVNGHDVYVIATPSHNKWEPAAIVTISILTRILFSGAPIFSISYISCIKTDRYCRYTLLYLVYV